MKKAIIITMVFAMALSMSLPALAATGISTGFTQVQAGGDAPIVKAKWEMNPIRNGSDDSTAAGAQFNPTGVKDLNRTITICAIATDPDGVSDINGVYADVFWPTNIDVGPSHTKLPSQTAPDGMGCGRLMQEDQLTELSKADGIELFCNKVRNTNTNLPTFNTNYTYDEICKADGELQKETAKVYCADKDLSYEDPSGNYKVTVMAQDKNSLAGTLDNYFEYLPLTAFETDFTSVTYGNVKLETHKIINGDLTWGTANLPTVRNVGNTRMNLTVSQNDMGLGKTNNNWNVQYDARVGSNASFAIYAPEETATLSDTLDLSELDEVDFSILVHKFPPTHPSTIYSGTMTLGAVSASHLQCEQAAPFCGDGIVNQTSEVCDDGPGGDCPDDCSYN